MLKRSLPLAVLMLFAASAPGHDAAQPAALPPTIVVRLASLDNLFEQFQILGGALGKDDFSKKIDEAIKGKLGAKGLHGIDSKRPLALYARVGGDISDISGVLMVPITSEKQFKQMLEDLGWEVTGDAAGLHTVKQNLVPVDVQYRIANNYAYIGLLGQDTLTPTNLVAPERIFTKKTLSAISLTIRLDQIPDGAKGMFLDVLKNGIGKVEDKPGENKAQKVIRDALTNEIQRILTNVLKDGEEVHAEIDINGKTRQMAVDMSLTGKAKSALAANIAKMGQRQTLFAGVLDKDAALNGHINFEVPADLRDALGSLVKEAFGQLGEGAKDDDKRKQTLKLLEALQPSLSAGELDAAFSMRGPHKSNRFTLVAGFKLKQGNKLAATLLELIKELPAGEQKLIQLNADKVGNVGIHKLALQGSFDADSKQMFGDYPLYVALRDDAFFLALGEEALAALKVAVAAPTAPSTAAGFDMSLSRFGAAMEKNTATAALAQKLAAGGDDARMRVSLEGGTALRVRFTMSLSAFKIFGEEK